MEFLGSYHLQTFSSNPKLNSRPDANPNLPLSSNHVSFPASSPQKLIEIPPLPTPFIPGRIQTTASFPPSSLTLTVPPSTNPNFSATRLLGTFFSSGHVQMSRIPISSRSARRNPAAASVAYPFPINSSLSAHPMSGYISLHL